MNQFWNERYKQTSYAYGTDPNVFFKDTIEKYQLKGEFLFAAEGEGRNAVYAATLGNKSYAFDTSEQGYNKALLLATKNGVSIDYQISSFDEYKSQKQFDAVVLCYAHLPADAFKRSYLKMARFVKPNGCLIIEGFSKEHQKHQQTNENAGGPKEAAMLFDTEVFVNYFRDFEIILAQTVTTSLNEGEFHQGDASVCRIIAKKNS